MQLQGRQSVLGLPKRVATAPFFLRGARPRQMQSHQTAIKSVASPASPSVVNQAAVQPAVLPGTPSTFPIKEDELIKLAKDLFIGADAGVSNPDLLADSFRFEFPVISLSKKEYVKAVSSFKLTQALPDFDPHPYHFRVDPYEPNRVWFTVRATAKHTGELKFGDSTFPPSGRVVQGAPECLSFTFDELGKATSYTGGYVMDRRVGNTQGLGAMFGVLAAIGGPVLAPGSPTYIGLTVANKARLTAMGAFNAVTFGAFKPKEDE